LIYRKVITMGGGERARFSPEFNDEAVRLVIESGRPIAQAARDLRINDGTYGDWVARYCDEHPVSEAPLSVVGACPACGAGA
jgi:transposase